MIQHSIDDVKKIKASKFDRNDVEGKVEDSESSTHFWSAIIFTLLFLPIVCLSQ